MESPLYRQVYQTLKERIISSSYSAGEVLPAEARLAEEFGVSLITVRRALQELALDGMIERRQGIGSIVRGTADNPVIVGMSSFTSDVASGRLRIVRTLMVDNLVPAAPLLAEKLEVQPGSLLRHLVRLDLEGTVPLSVDELFMPPALASAITSAMAASPVFLHLWQQQIGISLVRTQYEIGVEQPGASDQKLLQIGPEMPLLTTGELIFTTAGQPVMWIISRYRADRCKLSGTVMLVQQETQGGVVGE
jgi:GntR family transcriptional regulator